MSIVWQRLIQPSFNRPSQPLCKRLYQREAASQGTARNTVKSTARLTGRLAARLALMAVTGAGVCTILSPAAMARPNRANLPKTTIEAHHWQAPNNILSKAKSIRFRLSTPPPDRGTPRAPHGTGSRGDCLQPASLPPLSLLTGSPGLNLTISEHPQFWVYVPYAHADVATAKFSLQNGDTEVYQQAVQLPDTPGILAIAMPTTLPPLDVGTSYRWYFELACPQSDPTADPTPAAVTGSVQRVAPSATLLNELEIAQSPLETIEAYAENHIWYETLSQLAQLRLKNPNDQSLTEIWQTLLSDPDVGLGNWADMPILGDAVEMSDVAPSDVESTRGDIGPGNE